ncbi:MAG TPA: ATP synthase F1 subunit epsilon [Actinomycetota bacterium]|jgi:F-type H+-transporting ATPase subunit epsilon|nr:ATP synthase F1 subunit epsilon [Actinomycetota bacterium]
MLEVHVVSPERVVWAGPARMVVARGTAGEVGILPGHAPLLIRLAIGTLRIQGEDGGWERAVVDGGFLHVTSEGQGTRVDVLASHAEMAREIDRRAAEARVEELRAKLRQAEDAGARADLAKALTRVELTGDS